MDLIATQKWFKQIVEFKNMNKFEECKRQINMVKIQTPTPVSFCLQLSPLNGKKERRERVSDAWN